MDRKGANPQLMVLYTTRKKKVKEVPDAEKRRNNFIFGRGVLRKELVRLIGINTVLKQKY